MIKKYNIPEMEIMKLGYEGVITESNGDIYIEDTLENPNDPPKTEGEGWN